MKNDKEVYEVENETRKVVENGGIFKADVRKNGVLILNQNDPKLPDESFDIIVSVFCLESACANHEEYILSLENIVSTPLNHRSSTNSLKNLHFFYFTFKKTIV